MIESYNNEDGRQIWFIDLKGQLDPIEVESLLKKNSFLLTHTINFTRAEWWSPDARFILLRYAVNGEEQQYGIRFDMSKKVFLDSFANDQFPPSVDEKLCEIVPSIYMAVYYELQVFRLENALRLAHQELFAYRAEMQRRNPERKPDNCLPSPNIPNGQRLTSDTDPKP